MIIKQNFLNTISFIKKDHDSWPLRFWLEVIAWSFSIIGSLVLALTIPDAPFLFLYPIWIANCAIYAWCAWTRGSFGMLSNYILLTGIEMIGLTRLILLPGI